VYENFAFGLDGDDALGGSASIKSGIGFRSMNVEKTSGESRVDSWNSTAQRLVGKTHRDGVEESIIARH
jgi:hypothetical protein